MRPATLVATTGRVLRQLRHDHRTVALIVGVPVLLLTLLYYMFADVPVAPGQVSTFDRVGLIMLGIFPFVIMFLITSIAMQRERVSGTLERLMTTPMTKGDLLGGYGLAFSLVATLQAAIGCTVAYLAFDLDTAGSVGYVVLVAVLNAVLGVSLGLLASAFARTEFQAVQFFPLIALPQLLLCGLFVPRDQMAPWLEALSRVLPMTYAVEALQEIGAHAEPTATFWRDTGIVAGCVVVAVALAASTLRRQTP
jgi:ABC-2 type transport system permease protein